MAPKKGKKNKKEPPVLIDGVDTSQMDRDELQAFMLRIKEELDKERVERNYFQTERDKMRIFWESSRTQLEEAQKLLLQKDREIDAALEYTDFEGRKQVQKHKYMQYELIKRMSKARTDNMIEQKRIQEDHFAQLLDLFTENIEQRELMREEVRLHDARIEEMKRVCNAEMKTARDQYEQKQWDLIQLNIEHVQDERYEQRLYCEVRCFQIEECLNRQINEMREEQDEAFVDLKNYYNEITLNNLALINALKETLDIQEKENERLDKIATEALAENDRLREPLEIALKDLEDTSRKLYYCQQKLESQQRLKNKAEKYSKTNEHLKVETTAVELRNAQLTKDLHNVRSKFEDIVTEMQAKTSYHNIMLQSKLMDADIEIELARRQNAFLKVFIEARGKSECEVQELLSSEIRGIIVEKDEAIKIVRNEFLRVCKMHDDLIDAYAVVLARHGVPQVDLGFEPLRLSQNQPYVIGPAGFVTANK